MNEQSNAPDSIEVVAPSLTMSELKFSDGTIVSLNANDIVVFVGPNNAGKSASLREIESHLGNNEPAQVIKEVKVRKVGSVTDVERAFNTHSHKSYPNGIGHYSGHGYNVQEMMVKNSWNGNLRAIRPFFCRRLKTESRIIDSNPAASFKVLTEAASSPIQQMYADSDVEERISGYFRSAFDQDLIVLKAGGNEIPLLVGKSVELLPGEDPTKRSYLERLVKQAFPLSKQGDGMRSFASVILEMLANQTPTLLLLDEPEAFLHPPQARVLGEILAREKSMRTQMFIATHSPDVLMGLLSSAPEQLRVVRLQRNGKINSVKELEREKAKAIAADPLMKYSSVLSGVFHQRAIICEADADCLFYQALLSLSSVSDGGNPDVLFLHASGKHRMATIAEALRALGVPIDVIADIDVLNERDAFKKLVEALGGDWNLVEPHWAIVKKAIESRKPWLTASAVQAEIEKNFTSIKPDDEFPQQAVNNIKSALKKSSPWGAIKEAGDAAIPSGDPTKRMKELREYLQKIGLWIVPVGELEGFCKSVGGHGPKWVQKVIEDYDLANDPELESARTMIRKVWERALPSQELSEDEVISNEQA